MSTNGLPARDRFDQRHFIELYRRGLLETLPLELGPMPVVDLGHELWEDLIRWNVVDGRTGQLAPEAQELFAGIIDYDWALWGLVLLYNERRTITADLPEELFQFGVQYAVREIPRVPFLIGVRGQRVVTTVIANGEMDISSDPTEGPRDSVRHQQVGRILLSLLDPQRSWEPYPMPRVSIPAPHSGGAGLAAPRNGDSKARKKEARTTVATLEGAGSSSTAAAVIGELLSQDNPASAQITVSRRGATGVETAPDNAIGLLFFSGTKRGMVVSYPTRSVVGSPWVTYEPATPESVGRAIGAVREGLDIAEPDSLTVR